ncbi:MAG: hypothetical protein ACOYI4_04235 [Christensenellales bacterium]|jgi:spore germination protein KC
MKRHSICILIVLCCLLLTGCWDYQGLNEINIVTEIAVDKDALAGRVCQIEESI